MFKPLIPVVSGLLTGVVLWQVIGTGMYTYELSKFYGYDYKFSEHGIALNGSTWIEMGNYISIRDLAADAPGPTGSTPAQMCSDVTFERGTPTISFVGETAVCCWASNEDQWLVPFKDVADTRYYMCGKWPHIDIVSKPISKTKIDVELKQHPMHKDS